MRALRADRRAESSSGAAAPVAANAGRMQRPAHARLAAQLARGRNSACRSLRKSKPRSVGPHALQVALDQAALLRPARSAASMADSGSPVRSPKRASVEALAQAQRVEHELERQLGARRPRRPATARWPASALSM